jgi:phosphoribosyl 1,2-cyclic phosphate phosphodiesterase
MKTEIIVLGCGNSTGVPAIGNIWGACDPDEPKNKRTRASILVRTETTTLVIDTGPDFREQMNRENIRTINAALITHAHSDHINGIDELRGIAYTNKSIVPIYGNAWTIRQLDERWRYIFHGGTDDGLYPPVSKAHIIDTFGKPMKIGDIEFIPFEQDHGSVKTIGYRFGDFAYSTDMSGLDEAAIAALRGIKTWIVDAAGYKQTNNKVHANLENIYALNERIQAEQVWLTSLTLAMDYKTLNEELKIGYKPAHDGMRININI